MPHPDRLGNLRLADMQRPRLKEFDTGFVHRPFDLDGLSDDRFRLAHQQTELGDLLVTETARAEQRARKRLSAVSAAHAVVLPTRRGFLELPGGIEHVTVRR